MATQVLQNGNFQFFKLFNDVFPGANLFEGLVSGENLELHVMEGSPHKAAMGNGMK